MSYFKQIKWFLFLLVLCTASFVHAQELAIEGVVSCGDERAGFASVVLYADTLSAPLQVTYTDQEGFYRLELETKPTETLYLGVRYVGYMPFYAKLSPDTLTSDSPVRYDVNLEKRSTESEIEEIVITGKTTSDVDKKSYTFKTEEIKRARDCKELALLLPQLKADASTGRIIAATGRKDFVTIFINGHRGTNEDLQAIPPSKIIRVDFFDIPPLRYAEQGLVIDVITKPLDDGHHGGISTRIVPLETAAYASLYYRYNTGRHQFKLYSENFLRHLRKGRRTQDTLEYSTTDQRYSFIRDRIGKMKYHEFVLKTHYAYNEPEKQYFELSLASRLETFNDPTRQNSLAFIGTASQRERTGEISTRDYTITPAVDVYYEKTIGNSQFFASNLVYTHNQTEQFYSIKEINKADQQIVYTDEFEGKNKKHSVIAELRYDIYLGSAWLTFDYRSMYSYASFSMKGENVTNTADQQHQLRERLYVNWQQRKGKFFYSITPAVYIHYVSAHKGLEKAEIRPIFSPFMVLGYNLTNNHSLKMRIRTTNQIPDIGQTTELLQLVNENYYRRNNPLLKNSYTAKMNLYHSWANDYFSLNNGLEYKYIYHDWAPFSERTERNGKHIIVEQMGNIPYSQVARLELSGEIRPLGNEMLALRLYAKPGYQLHKYSNQLKPSLFSIPVGGGLTCQMGDLSLQADIDAPYEELSADSRMYNGWYSSLASNLELGRWQISLFLEHLFTAERYYSKSHSFYLIQSRDVTTLPDNKWRFGFSVNYSFSIGKEYENSRRLENEDTDRAKLR